MAAKCDYCGAQIPFGGSSSTQTYQGEKFKLCESCFIEWTIMERTARQGNTALFQKQYDAFSARMKQENVAPMVLAWRDSLLNSVIRQRQNEEKSNAMLLTTGDFFEDHHVRKYLGVVTGETILGTGFLSEFKASFSDLLGEESNAFMDKMKQAREASMKRLKKNALDLEANAVLGIHFSVLTLGQNMMGVSATGTAVLLEPDAKT